MSSAALLTVRYGDRQIYEEVHVGETYMGTWSLERGLLNMSVNDCSDAAGAGCTVPIGVDVSVDVSVDATALRWRWGNGDVVSFARDGSG